MARRGSKRLRMWLEARPALIGILTVLAAVAIWAYTTRQGGPARGSVVSPWDLFAEFRSLAVNGYTGRPIWDHVGASLLRTTMGFVSGSICGVIVGLAMGYSPIVSSALAPFFSFIRPIPAIAYIPMVILWFGIGEFSKILLIFIASFLYVALNTAAGVKAVPQDLIRVARTLGANHARLFFLVILPESLPYVMLGLKVALALSWAVVVAAELVAAQEGLGYLIMDAGTFFRIPDLYVGIVLIGLVGLLLERGLTLLEARFVHWSGK
jgi:ABC-type nitrate/sulfonate/bicarbonate transport system permease component